VKTERKWIWAGFKVGKSVTFNATVSLEGSKRGEELGPITVFGGML
jgi:hypothetical protein